MKRTLITAGLLIALAGSISAQSNVEKAERFRLQKEASTVATLTASEMIQVAATEEAANVLENNASAQLQELGPRWRWWGNTQQIDELGPRWKWWFNAQQIDELGPRWKWWMNAQQIDELGPRWKWWFNAQQIDELGPRWRWWNAEQLNNEQ